MFRCVVAGVWPGVLAGGGTVAGSREAADSGASSVSGTLLPDESAYATRIVAVADNGSVSALVTSLLARLSVVTPVVAARDVNESEGGATGARVPVESALPESAGLLAAC